MNLFWFRTDLRLIDNTALHASLENDQTYLLYIIDSSLLEQVAHTMRFEFLLQSLQILQEELQKHGKDILILEGKPTVIIPQLCKELKVSSLYFNTDYTPFAKKRDSTITEILTEKKIQVFSMKDAVIFEKNEITKKDGTQYKVFTPYKKVWLKRLNERNQFSITPISFKNILTASKGEKQVSLKDFRQNNHVKSSFYPGFREAAYQWEIFRNEKLSHYTEDKDRLDKDGTSKLSPYIKFGCISIRQLVQDIQMDLAKGKNAGAQKFLEELIWRDFYKMVMDENPIVKQSAQKEKFRSIAWKTNEIYLKAWQEGKTGYPIVDAAMRQLKQEGWIPNRARMIVASFLCKDLLIDWKVGEKYFSEQLIDYDATSNNGGWQWTAGVGTDAAPYFRIFNPLVQSKKFDPTGLYIKKYIPELKNISAQFLLDFKYLQKNAPSYPFPIINHQEQKKAILKLYNAI